MVVTPPPVERIPTPPGTFALSFHTISRIGAKADETSGLCPAAQKIPAPSLNSVPPTAMLFGVEASPLTAWIVPTAAVLASQPAAPVSPVLTKAVIPSAAACVHRLFQKVLPVAPRLCSQRPKLVLITGATLLFTMYCAERLTPSVVRVDLEITNLIVAFFATAPDHSTSRSASSSSLPFKSPGAFPL